jgi:hypothetical protein
VTRLPVLSVVLSAVPSKPGVMCQPTASETEPSEPSLEMGKDQTWAGYARRAGAPGATDRRSKRDDKDIRTRNASVGHDSAQVVCAISLVSGVSIRTVSRPALVGTRASCGEASDQAQPYVRAPAVCATMCLGGF